MKMTAKLVLAAAIGASVCVVCAWAQEVASAQSANAVGVVKYTVPPEEGLVCIAMPLNPLETTSTNGYWVWGETSLASQLDIGSMVYFWDGTRWKSYQKTKMGGWNKEARTTEIQPGTAFFVKSASTNYDDKVISLLGELPTEGQLEYSVPGDGVALETRGVTLYPVAQAFGESELSTALPTGSMVYFWEGTRWKSYQKTKLGGWNKEVKGTTNFVGEGIFIKAASSIVVTNERPFDWDN